MHGQLCSENTTKKDKKIRVKIVSHCWRTTLQNSKLLNELNEAVIKYQPSDP